MAEHEIDVSSPGSQEVIRELTTILGLMQQIKALGGAIGVSGPGGAGLGFGGGGAGGSSAVTNIARLGQISATGVRSAITADRIAERFDRQLEAASRKQLAALNQATGNRLLGMNRGGVSAVSGGGGIGPGLWLLGNVGGMAGRKPEFGGYFSVWSQTQAENADVIASMFPRSRGGLGEEVGTARQVGISAATKRALRRGWKTGIRYGGRTVQGMAKGGRLLARAGSPVAAVVAADMAIQGQLASSSGESDRAKLMDRYQTAATNARRFGISPHPMWGDRGDSSSVAGYSPWDIGGEAVTWGSGAVAFFTGRDYVKNRYNVETALANYASAWNNQAAYDSARQAAYEDPFNDPVKSLREKYKEHYGARPKAEAQRSTLTIFARTAKGG